MLVMVSGVYTYTREGFGLPEVARHFAGSAVWQFLAYQFSHVEWRGASFWDLIQPSFVFMVGVSMPYSYSKRLAKGDSHNSLVFHALYRSVVLILLGTIGFIFLGNWVMFHWPEEINLHFDTVLTQIGLGYLFVFLLLRKRVTVQFLVAFGILAVYWLAFVLYPLPGSGFDYVSVGASDELQRFTGFFAHWNKNTNLAADFDRWFLNRIPRSQPFLFQGGGTTTLNFIPTISTMIFGVITGGFLRGPKSPKEKLKGLLFAGSLFLLVGIILNYTLCPIVKAIWTPSWAIYSTGWVLLMLAAFFWWIEVEGHRGFSFPLAVVGMNAIAVYCTAKVFNYYIFRVWEKSLGENFFSGLYGPIWKSLTPVISLWIVSLIMYRRRIFIRI